MTHSPEDNEDEPTDADDIWAEALAEQAAAESTETSDDPAAADWATAMAEQEAATASADQDRRSARDRREADDDVFHPLTGESETAAAAPLDLEMIMDIPVTLSVELGSTRLSIRELLDLGNGSTVELDELAGQPMNILVNGHLVAKGEVVVVEAQYGIRVTEIIDRPDRINPLKR